MKEVQNKKLSRSLKRLLLRPYSMEDELQEIVKRNVEPMEGSKIFLSLFSDSMAKEAMPVVQIGLAILMDKPIYLLVKSGSTVPKHLLKVASGVEYLVSDSEVEFKTKTNRLLEKALGSETKNK